ncbi:hypothetical protein ER70_07095, partial (plasmid) [Borreliella bissettiae]
MYVRGIKKNIKKLGIFSLILEKLIFNISLHIENPTYISAAAVALAGTAINNGERNIAIKNIMPVTIVVSPV